MIFDSPEFECASFRAYSLGKNAKEHEEMTILEKVQSENSAAREADFQRMKDWRAEDVSARRWSEIRSWLAFVVSVLALLATIWLFSLRP